MTLPLGNLGSTYATTCNPPPRHRRHLKQLLRLQAANVRWPLHEADGAWFWWRAYGPESCKTLCCLMFDRYTNVHGLRNQQLTDLGNDVKLVTLTEVGPSRARRS